MPVTDRDRNDLYVAARDTLGEHPAEVLMAMLPPVGWGDVATKADLHATATELRAVNAEFRADLQVVKADLEAFKRDVNAQFNKVGARFDKMEARFDKVDARFDKVDARFDKMEARIGAIVPQQIMANIAIMAALLALVFTILRFA